MSVTDGEQGLWRQFELWAERIGLARKMAVALTLAAGAAAIATYLTFTDIAGVPQSPRLALALLTLDIVLLLLLVGLVARRLVGLWAERRRVAAGSGLHRRLAVLFSLVA